MKLKHQSFIAELRNQNLAIPNSQPIASQISESEKIKHTLIGSNKTVIRTIQILNKLGYANIQQIAGL